MKRLLCLVVCLALLVPALALDRAAHAEQGDRDRAGSSELSAPLGFDSFADERLRVLERARRPQDGNQVRVERRVVIRIAPSSQATRTRLLAELPRRPLETQYEEVEHDDCIPIEQLAGVQPIEGNRLLLIMRNRQLLTASLERSCSAQAFYSGFYIERNEDGRLCVDRDQLQSRAGASCGVEGFSRLVAVRD